MSKVKYKFNTKNLTYEKVSTTIKERTLKFLSYLATGTVFATITIILAYNFLDSPKEKKLRREIEKMKNEYEALSQKMTMAQGVLADLQDRDNNIYRVIFEADPIPDNIRKAGFGGSDRYAKLQGFENTNLMEETSQKLDKLLKQIYIQSKSFDDVLKLAKNKEEMINSIPAIMPLNIKNLIRQPGGFGWRTHPIYKTQEFHPGMDFPAAEGVPIYATGDGVVEQSDANMQGYGNHVVINHGYSYQTLYGHMSKILVKAGQKVKRGQLIGLVGSTGLSTAPHLHYEVIKNGQKVNPINFYYNDLSPEEYQQMLQLSQQSSQSFD
ncbi:MAG TPA: M23 family metallopeptidase [Bacteroidia bacterium]|jgi:septal ring factor EnvC (AmiA/AmiB activator)|nr:M23 family metallopeptidase [Bacteroidia bacterium]